MTPRELQIVQRLYRPTRVPDSNELAELIGLVRLLANKGCAEPGGGKNSLPCLDRKRGRSSKSDLCWVCHAEALLQELEYLNPNNQFLKIHIEANRICRQCENDFQPKDSNADSPEFWCSRECEQGGL